MRALAAAALVAVVAALGAGPDPSYGAPSPSDPIFVFSPDPAPPPALIIPPPNGYLNDPCGLAVDSGGNFYIADHYHDVVDVYDGNADYVKEPPVYGSRGYLGQLRADDPLDGPCGLALGNGDELYVSTYHRSVREYGPRPGFAPGPFISGAGADSNHPTGVAVDPASGNVYVDERSHVGVYESSGAPVEAGGAPLRIGEGTLDDGYGLAVSAYPGTAGYVYVPDAASGTVKVYDPATDLENPVMTIAGPPGGFSSLRDSAAAVDRVSGDVYVVDDLQPAYAESPHALVDVFDSAGLYLGHLKYEVGDGRPAGLAVDNSAGPNQGRVYVTSGNTHLGAVYAYPPGAVTTTPPLVGSAPPAPLGGTSLFPVIEIGGTTGGQQDPRIPCDGDACQILPSPPHDGPLATLASGSGNPPRRYRRYGRRCRPRPHRHRAQRASRCRRSRSSVAPATAGARAEGEESAIGAASRGAVSPAPALTASLPAVPAGFDAHVWADGGEPAALAGSHPYALSFSLGLDQSGGEADLRDLRIELPTGMLADPAAAALCTAASFGAPRSSPFEAATSGESCQGRSQVGTVEAANGAGEVRRFGLFDLAPPDGAAARLAAAPFGRPIVFDIRFVAGEDGSVHLSLEASDIAAALTLHGLRVTLWGTPWDATHNGERGNCLNEVEPSFPWAKCSAVGEPISSPPLAFLTLPTDCGGSLAFTARARSWQGVMLSAAASNRDSSGQSVPFTGCETLHYEPRVTAGLAGKRTSSPSGFVLRLTHNDSGFIDPRRRSEPRARSAVVHLPAGVTLNPSLGAGLEGCTPAQFAAESATGAEAEGCPNGAKIGEVSLNFPFYKGEVDGALYLAQPGDNPYGSLLAVYLVAKAADRGVLVKARGKLTPDPGNGTLTARFDDLSQLPYAELKVVFRDSQRAPLVTPPICGRATTRIESTSWADTSAAPSETDSPLEAGVEGSPCPTVAPPFNPGVMAGAVNSNINSYTPYAIHISRQDSEQEITSYSLVLPKGITGKLAGIPFCSDAAIAAARENRGFAEAAHPSCPRASQVGRTFTGYGVGPALAYSEGKVYLAGPYHGAPLSLVTINPATVGPFDVGTIVVRSAFDLDPRTAQLRIDSRGSDPIPHILDGIVLHVRDIRVYIDRPEFTHNPSSCEPSQLISTITGSGTDFGSSADDSTATVSEHFQLLNCRALGFRPKLGLRLRGPSHRGAFSALRATFVSRGARDSNLDRIEVDMPHQLFLAQNHIRTVCTGAQFATGRCPPGSAYGAAVAYTPLLDEPLRGHVYLRSSSHKLPDLVADLHSGAIRIELEGRIGPTKRGGIRVFFADLPDAPIERFTMLLWGGRRGLLTNSVNVCRRPPVAAVRALGQNDLGAIFTARLRGQCRPHTGNR